MAIKMSLEFAGFDSVLQQLTKLQADTKTIAEDALKEAFDIVTDKAERAAVPANYPAGGKYSRSTRNTAQSLVKTPSIKWEGTTAVVDVGFRVRNGGLPSIFMIRGTPYHAPVQAMYDAFYSEQTRGEVYAAQQEIFNDAMRKMI